MKRNRPLMTTCVGAAGFLACGVGWAQAVAINSLADLSLEQLSNIEVTSVSGRAESLQDAPASIYVITADDIRRSAAVTLPQALRLAPNLQVAQLSGGQYAISARGFNNSIGNKLLVLIDGRTVYSALYSGVFWDANDVMLEDVERIEVISGPGGTLWGANAVNGVINVITRSPADTAGVLAAVTRSSGGGQEAARYGGKLGDDGHFRVYGLAQDRSGTAGLDGTRRNDASAKKQIGFRADWGSTARGFSVQGDAYRGGSEPASSYSPRLEGGNLLARWNTQLADGSPLRLQAYADHAARDETTVFRNRADTVDLQFSHEPAVTEGQRLLWGGGWRRTRDANDPSIGGLLAFVPAERTLQWTNVFAQYERKLGTGLNLTLGAKLEHNDYTGTEVLPNLRLAYKSGNQLTWGALSRAVRAPSRFDRDFALPAAPPFVVHEGTSFVSEIANVIEIGQRGLIGDGLSYSVTVYHQRFDRLRSLDASRLVLENMIAGHTTGLEAWASWQAGTHWRVSGGLTELRKSLRVKPPSADVASLAAQGDDPRHQWQLRSSWDLGRHHELDLTARHVSGLPAPEIAAYTAVDARWNWTATPTLTVSLLAHNLFDRQHIEFRNSLGASQIERRVFLRLTWKL